MDRTPLGTETSKENGMGVGLEETAVKNPLRRAVARWISIIVHPIAFPLLTLAVIVWTTTQSARTASRWVLIAVALTSVPVAALVALQVLRGRWTDLDVSVRKQRYALYPFGLACMLLLLVVFVWLDAPRVAVRAATAWSLSNIADGLINLFYKVSAHATGAAVCAALLVVDATPVWGVVGVCAALAVGWSRVELGRHTPGQVLLGWGVGVASTALALTLV
jgi:membrane-associated phospholipid phosphatase